MRRSDSPIGTALGIVVAGVAVVGTQVLGWEWGAGETVPTVVGVVVALMALALVARRWL